MKVDYLSIHFKTSMISSRTKHESFDSFGSHAQLLMGTSHIFFLCNEPIFSSLFIFKKEISKLLTNRRPEYSEDSSDQTNNCQQSCFFLSKEFLLLYFIHRSSISHCIKKGLKLNTHFFHFSP